jgi:hypothetical protein
VLPPRPAIPPPSPEGFLRRARVLDAILVLLVLGFAFLVALFPIRNTDFLLHLATGRAIAQGEHQFGTDPFTYTSEGNYWVNHSWLFDLACYAINQMTGGGGELLVVLKALAIAALAGVLILAGRRTGQSLWIPALCAALAVLVLSPRLFVQPTLISYAFLAVTFCLLQRGDAASGDPKARRLLWLLPPLFVLWVNLDSWFLVGPLTVGLYLVAEILQGQMNASVTERASALRTLGLVFVAGLVACLINPHHYHVFELPTQLGLTGASEVLRQDTAFRSWFVSPFSSVYFQASFGLNAAGLAYFLLVLLGVVSFVLTWEFGGPAPRGQSTLPRLVIWMAFFVLSFFYARTIPFFAVVAGPITALNFLDFAARRFGDETRLGIGWRRWGIAGRVLSLLACVALLATTWPGWLQSRPQEWRRVGVGLVFEPSLTQAAERIKEWRTRNLLPEGARCFNASPDVASYLAWFCPGERTFLDFRMAATAEAARDFTTVRRALLEGLIGPDSPAPEEGVPLSVPWDKVFRNYGVRYVVLFFAEPRLAFTALQQTMSFPQEWAPLYVDGRTVIFGWTDPTDRLEAPIGQLGKKPADDFAGLRLNFDRLAFGPGAIPAPRNRPERTPKVHPWWTTFLEPVPARPLDSDQAFMDWSLFEVQRPLWAQRNHRDWGMIAFGSLTALAGGPGGPVTTGALPIGACVFNPYVGSVSLSNYVATLDAAPPADLYLAIRAARRGLALNPDDARTWLILGQSYFRLSHHTREQSRGRPLPLLQQVRQIQTVSALNQALTLGQELANDNLVLAQQAHETLALVYREMELLDLWAQHEREFLRLAKLVGRLPREKPEDFKARLEDREKQLQALDAEIRKRSDDYELEAANKPVREQAGIARSKGLILKALDLLRKADAQDILATEGPQRAADVALLQLSLMFALGQVEDVREGLDEGGLKNLLGMMPDLPIPAYDWFEVLLAAASGDYEQADKGLEQLQQQMSRNQSLNLYAYLGSLRVVGPPRGEPPPLDVATAVSLLVGYQILQDARPALGLPWQMQPMLQNRFQILGHVVQLAVNFLGQEADLGVLRGWLALEAGALTDARTQLEQALRRTGWLEDRGWHVRFAGRGLAELGMGWLKP